MRYGNNLNQIARKLNQSDEVEPADLTGIQDAIAQLYLLRTEFRKALGYDS